MPLSERDQSIVKMVARAARRRYDELKDALSTDIKALSGQVVELRAAVDHVPERGEKGERGQDGKSVTAEDVLPALKAHVDALVREFPVPADGQDGESVTPDDVFPLIEAKFEGWARDFERHATGVVQRALERIPEPRQGRDGLDGKDSDPDIVAAKVIERLDLKGTRTDMKRLCGELVDTKFAEVRVPKDGKDATDEQIAAAVAKYIEAHPPAAGRDGLHGKDGADGLHGKDGESVTIDEIEALVERRLSARVSEWALDFEKRAQDTLQKAVDRLPKPRDGVDGISFDAWRVEMMEDGRTLRFYAEAEGRKAEHFIRLTHVIDRGVHKEDSEYMQGDGVTWGGSFWIAQKDAPQGKPGQYNRDWRLAVKRGRDGSSS